MNFLRDEYGKPVRQTDEYGNPVQHTGTMGAYETGATRYVGDSTLGGGGDYDSTMGGYGVIGTGGYDSTMGTELKECEQELDMVVPVTQKIMTQESELAWVTTTRAGPKGGQKEPLARVLCQKSKINSCRRSI
ncbi:unnamed protein product [Amaranthus hypochondriacus]